MRGDAPWVRVDCPVARCWVGAASAVDDVEAAVLTGFLAELAVVDWPARACWRGCGRPRTRPGHWPAARSWAPRSRRRSCCLLPAPAVGAASRSGARPRGRRRGDHPKRGHVDRLDPAGTDQPRRGRGRARPVLPRRTGRADPSRTQTQRVPPRPQPRVDRPGRSTSGRSPPSAAARAAIVVLPPDPPSVPSPAPVSDPAPQPDRAPMTRPARAPNAVFAPAACRT